MKQILALSLAIVVAAPPAGAAESVCKLSPDKKDQIRAALCRPSDDALTENADLRPGCAERAAVTRLAPVARNIQILELCGYEAKADEARTVYLAPGETTETLLACVNENFSHAALLADLEAKARQQLKDEGATACDPARDAQAQSILHKLTVDGLALTLPSAREHTYYELGVAVTDDGAIIDRPVGWQPKPNKGSPKKGTQEPRPKDQ